MSEVKIKVPDGMLEAFHRAENHNGTKWDDAVLYAMLEAALRWMDGELEKMVKSNVKSWNEGYNAAISDVRRMFLAPEPEFIGPETVAQFCARFQTIGEAAIEAYRLGQKSPS